MLQTTSVTEVLNKADWLAGHSLPQDVSYLISAGVQVPEGWATGEKTLDSLLLARMHDENDLSYGLENLLASFALVNSWKGDTRKLGVFAEKWPVDLRKDRCRKDAWAARIIAEHFYHKLADRRALVRYTHRTAFTLERLRLAGAVVDCGTLDKLDTQFSDPLLFAKDRLIKHGGMYGIEGFSPTNDRHLRQLLFDCLELEPVKYTKTKQPAVDKFSLKQLHHPLVDLLLDYNKWDKMYSVNIEGVRKHLLPAGEIEGRAISLLPVRINPLGARTGRRSSNKPNTQNWPEAVKEMVRSRWPGGMIANLDYKRLEVVLIALIAQDDKLLSFFTKGRGYLDVAHEMLRYDVQEGTPEYRMIKSVVLGVHYNMQTPKMARQLRDTGIVFSADPEEHEKETDRIRTLYLRRFRGISRYIAQQEETWLRTGESRNMVGRVRHLPVPDRGEEGYGHMLNQAINFPVQSLASEVMASAMIDAEAAFARELGMSISQYYQALVEQQRNLLTRGWSRGILVPVSQMFNEVHDALVTDMYPETSTRDIDILITSMREVKSLKALVPEFNHEVLDVDVKLYPVWKSK